MQVNNRHIDEVFAQKLGMIEIEPPVDGWERIERVLDRRKRSIRLVWAAAASVAILLGGAATFILHEQSIGEGSEQIAVVSSAPKAESRTFTNTEQPVTAEIMKDNRVQAHNSAVPTSIKQQAVTPASGHSQVEEAENHSLAAVLPATQATPVISEATNATEQPQMRMPFYSEASERKDIPTLAGRRVDLSIIHPELKPLRAGKPMVAEAKIPVYNAFSDEVEEIASTQRLNKWGIAAQAAPAMSYRFSNVDNTSRSSNVDVGDRPIMVYSGGVNVAYSISGRFSVQMGVYYTQMGQSISTTSNYSGFAAPSTVGIYTKDVVRTSAGNIALTSAKSTGDAGSNYFLVRPVTSRKEIHIDYVEIPMLLRYKIIDKKLDFSVIGGMGANILVSNEVISAKDGVTEGSVLMARPVNYNGMMGLGLNYQATDKLQIGIEPMFKYFLHSYSSSDGIHPFSLGLYTGILYQF